MAMIFCRGIRVDSWLKFSYNHSHNRLLRATGERRGNNHEEARMASLNAAARLGWGTDHMVGALFCIAGGKPMDTSSARLLTSYLQRLDGAPIDPAAAAFFASLDQVYAAAPVVAQAIVQELRDQRANLKLIASENYCS